MRTLHGEQHTRHDFINSKQHLTSNLISGFTKLCVYSDILGDGSVGPSAKVSKENKELRDKVASLNERIKFTPELLSNFKTMLNDEGIQTTLKYRYQFQLLDNFDYLVDHMDDYCKPDYIPTFEDYLNVQQR
eukprot:288426_1